MSEISQIPHNISEKNIMSRRRLVTAAAWAAPVIAVSSSAPAYAASGAVFGVNFDGGGGANGFVNSVYLNLGVAQGYLAPFTLRQPLVIIVDVVGLNPDATNERSFTAGSSYGTLQRGNYNPDTRTTTFVWTLPAGERIPGAGTTTNVPDILFSFRDGFTFRGRITNKIVVRGVTGGAITQPTGLPVDSSVVRDINGRAASPDGIY